jgi:methionine sulfoxide reductase heme-binding subunit
MNPQIWWYLSRAAGIVAWSMLTASVLWGVILASDLFPRWRRASWLLTVHRWLAALTFAFLATHLGALVADKHAHFAALDLVLPFHGSWRPTAVAVGVVAVWLLVAIEATALLLRRLSAQVWRGIHIAGYWVFWGTTIHAALSGTDASSRLYTFTSIAALGVVAFALSYRVLTHHLPKRRAPRGGRQAAA